MPPSGVFALYLLISVLAIVLIPAHSLQCLDPHGAPVDHWFAIKLPKGVGNYEGGYSFIYFDSKSRGLFTQMDFRYFFVLSHLDFDV